MGLEMGTVDWGCRLENDEKGMGRSGPGIGLVSVAGHDPPGRWILGQWGWDLDNRANRQTGMVYDPFLASSPRI